MNIYTTPEQFGLRIFGVLREPDLSWAFNFVVVWEDLETHRLYYGNDSGCSCPTPFEDIGRGGLTPIDNYDACLLRFMTSMERTRPTDGSWSPDMGEWAAARIDLLGKVRSHLDRYFPV